MGTRRSGALATLGLVVLASAVWHYVVLDTPSTIGLHDVVAGTMVGGAGVGLCYGAYWYAIHGGGPDRYGRIAAWMGGSTLLFGSVGTIILYAASQRVRPAELVEALHVAGSVGLAAGLLVGTIHTRAIANADVAARSEARAAALEAERERLEELNGLLRHYVLNGMQIVGGYVDQLRDVVPAEEQATLDVIDERADAIVTLIEHVRTVSVVKAPDSQPKAIDLGDAIDEAVAAADADGITIDAPDDDDISVYAAELPAGLSLLCDALTTVLAAGGTLAFDSDRRDAEVALTLTATPIVVSHAGSGFVFEPGNSAPNVQFHLAQLLLDATGDFELRRHTDDVLQYELTMERVRATGAGSTTG